MSWETAAKALHSIAGHHYNEIPEAYGRAHKLYMQAVEYSREPGVTIKLTRAKLIRAAESIAYESHGRGENCTMHILTPTDPPGDYGGGWRGRCSCSGSWTNFMTDTQIVTRALMLECLTGGADVEIDKAARGEEILKRAAEVREVSTDEFCDALDNRHRGDDSKYREFRELVNVIARETCLNQFRGICDANEPEALCAVCRARTLVESELNMSKIHPTAIISPRANIADDVEIGPFCVIGNDVVIGSGTRVMEHVVLRKGTSIGKNCYIDAGVKMSGDCVICNNVTVRYDAIIAKGCVVGDGSFISPQVMTINLDHQGNAIGGAKIGEKCHIGTNATLNPGITIADGAVIGAKALVTRNCPEPSDVGAYVGIPAKLKRKLTGDGDGV